VYCIIRHDRVRDFGNVGIGGGRWHVDLRSTLGEGSTFTITLPRESELPLYDDASLTTTGESVVFVGTGEGPIRPIDEA